MHDHVTPTRRVRRGFTLTELLIAVAVLAVVILATAKIFGTASQVTGVGQATADIMQEITAFERTVREDLRHIDRQGFLAIRCISLENDSRGADEPLINPNLPFDARVRSDQMVFFKSSRNEVQVFRAGSGSYHKPQAMLSRIYYGHGYQMPGALDGDSSDVTGPDPLPWQLDSYVTAGGEQFLEDVPATDWTLSRQAVLLADDGGSPFVYLQQAAAAETIWDDEIRNGRVDVAATEMDDITDIVTNSGSNNWGQQRNQMRAAIRFPRAERVASSMRRVDHATTTSVLGSACSSFIVEWTYRDLTVDGQQAWIGLPDPDRGSVVFSDEFNINPPLYPANAPDVDGVEGNPDLGGLVYESFFGFNDNRPLNEDGDPDADLLYTPWPDAIRITMVLHDTNAKLPLGRVVQFVVDLPRP